MGHDRERLDAVCRAEFPRLIGLITLQVGDRHVAEELAQDALTELILRWDKVDRPEAWLTRVALNVSNSWLRRRSAERRAYRRHGHTHDLHRDPEAADAVALSRAVAALPARQRTAVAMRFYEQCSVAETAEFMGCAEGTVKALTHRAMTALRDIDGFVHEEANDHA